MQLSLFFVVTLRSLNNKLKMILNLEELKEMFRRFVMKIAGKNNFTFTSRLIF